MKPKFAGMERANSVTIDGHKMLYTNYPCGGIVFKNKDSLRFLDQKAAYILDKFEGEVNHGSFTIEGSRPTDGILQLYGSILALGKEGYETIVDHVVEMTQYLAARVDESPTLVRLHDPEMNDLAFQYVPQDWANLDSINELNKQLNREIYRDGDLYVGGTGELVFADQPSRWAQRVCIFHPYTETANIDAMIAKVETIGAQLTHRLEAQNGQ